MLVGISAKNSAPSPSLAITKKSSERGTPPHLHMASLLRACYELEVKNDA